MGNENSSAIEFNLSGLGKVLDSTSALLDNVNKVQDLSKNIKPEDAASIVDAILQFIPEKYEKVYETLRDKLVNSEQIKTLCANVKEGNSIDVLNKAVQFVKYEVETIDSDFVKTLASLIENVDSEEEGEDD